MQMRQVDQPGAALPENPDREGSPLSERELKESEKMGVVEDIGPRERYVHSLASERAFQRFVTSIGGPRGAVQHTYRPLLLLPILTVRSHIFSKPIGRESSTIWNLD